jgi:NAD(P)-dependent dehydrogenase (short-subunit alcohol dehydrogenase family)
MPNTVFITGASTGFGRATAVYFQSQGWNVVATMRSTQDGSDLAQLENVLVTHLDVTNGESIRSAVAETLQRFNTIDVLVNNAGFGAYGPLEITDMDVVRRQFDTNVIGLLEVTKEVIPHLRTAKDTRNKVIVNISSIGGRVTFPLGSLYHGSKFAVEGISESLAYELKPLGIDIKLIEPGLADTDFAGRSFVLSVDPDGGPYAPTVNSVLTVFGAMQTQVNSSAEEVARAIFTAATDNTDQLRYVVGEDARALVGARANLDDSGFMSMMSQNFGLTD